MMTRPEEELVITKTRYTNYGNLKGQPSTHEPEFIEAFHRQKRGAAVADELTELKELEAELLAEDEFSLNAFQVERLAFLQGYADEAAAFAPSDAITLQGEEIEVVEIDTISGPRSVMIDQIDEFYDLGVVIILDTEPAQEAAGIGEEPVTGLTIEAAPEDEEDV